MSIKVLLTHASTPHGELKGFNATQEMKRTFGRLLEEAADHGKNIHPSSGPSFSLEDVSLLQLAGFNPISFTQTGSKGEGLSGMASAHLSTSLYLKIAAGQDQGIARPFLGQNGLTRDNAQNPSLLQKAEKLWLEHGPAMRDVSGLGALSAQFESGTGGVGAIGYDRNGGTSYGTYQISSRQGTMTRFIDFLQGADPKMAERLRRSGSSDTGSTHGPFPDTWKSIAAENPQWFEHLQRRFIKETHYDPAAMEIKNRTNLDISQCSPALQQVLWSTAVQHGPRGAAVIFQDALKGSEREEDGLPGKPANELAIIERVYSLRSTQFGSSTPEVQASVHSRFKHERQMALTMLRDGQRIA